MLKKITTVNDPNIVGKINAVVDILNKQEAVVQEDEPAQKYRGKIWIKPSTGEKKICDGERFL